MPIKLIATDLDGTLLRRDHLTVSVRNQAALYQASRKGALLVIASGRAFALLSNVLPQLPNVEYALTSNGAAITHVPTGRQILRETIPATKSQALIRVLEECGAIFEVYCEGNSFVEKSVYDRFTSPHLSREFIAELRSHITPVDSLSKALFGKEIEKINALLIPEDSRTPLLEKLNNMGGLSVTSSLPGNLELNREGVNKGAALQSLCCGLGIQPDEVMAFGDEDNDLEMLSLAGWSFAMGNGNENVKSAASRTTGSNEEDGIAEALERYFLNP